MSPPVSLISLLMNSTSFDLLRLRSLNDGKPSSGNVESGSVRDIATAGDLWASMNSATAAVPGATGSGQIRPSPKALPRMMFLR